MKLTLIGPWGAYPRAGEATAGYLLEHGDEKILIDCGSGVLSKLQSYIALNQLTSVFISHMHHDHVADLGCLQYACLIDTDLKRRAKPLPIYVASESKEAELAYHSLSGSEVISLYETDIYERQGLSFTFFKTFHGAFCLAMKVRANGKTIVYTADTYYDESLIPFCKDADLLIAETSFYAEFTARNYGHMNTAEVGTLAAQANVKKLVLTHLPHFGDLETLPFQVREHYKGDVVLGASGLEFIL
jgi:ribonuclease BN (tRNA processing enzyme)